MTAKATYRQYGPDATGFYQYARSSCCNAPVVGQFHYSRGERFEVLTTFVLPEYQPRCWKCNRELVAQAKEVPE